MEEDLNQLGEDLVTTAARIVRWVQTDGLTLSLASARILARLYDNGPSRISDLAARERSSQPTITNHVKRLEAAHLVERSSDPSDARAWMIKLTDLGHQQLVEMRTTLGTAERAASSGPNPASRGDCDGSTHTISSGRTSCAT